MLNVTLSQKSMGIGNQLVLYCHLVADKETQFYKWKDMNGPGR